MASATQEDDTPSPSQASVTLEKASSRLFPIRSVLYPSLLPSSPTKAASSPLSPPKKEDKEPPSSVPEERAFLTTRLVAAPGKGTSWVLTGRQGKLERCEDEPIHAPGAIQSFGVLIAFDVQPDGALLVQQVSENSDLVIGIPPSSLLSAPSLSAFLPPAELDVLLDMISLLDDRDADESAELGPITFTLSGVGSVGDWTAHAAIHRPAREKAPQRIVLELELEKDKLNPLSVGEPEGGQKGGMASTGVVEPTLEELEKSTRSLVKPLRALERWRGGRARGRETEMDVVGLLSQINEQLASAEALEPFLQITAGIFKELTSFDRVMVYQFDEHFNGQVVAEQVDWSRTKDLFRGLNFPASDIPAQARELYRINKVRLLYNRDSPTARLCCRSLEEVENPIDMTHCHLRAMSPIHLKYLANMEVRSSMSISITAFGELWGLVALHSYGTYGRRVSFPVRQLCKLLGDSISRNLERLSYVKRLHARKLVNTVPTSANPSGYIVAKAEDLLLLFGAEFGVLSIGDEAKILGAVDNSQELLAVLEYLRTRCFTQLQASQDIRKDFPDLEYPLPFTVIAGLLVVPLSSEGKDFIVFFRRGQLREVKWAGNPYTNKTQEVNGEVFQPHEPRRSFKTWSETVASSCRTWSDEQLETAGVLCLVYGKFIDVWRQKETALAANQLTNLLLANASHEVRTPLNAIINYLELALDGPVEGEVRENLARSHAASKSLIHVINDLLDLTRTEKGNDLFLQDPFDISSTINEAIATHKIEAQRLGLSLDVVESPSGTPPTVLGDRGKIRQIITNVVANAVKHTTKGGILVEWGELVDGNIADASERRRDAIRIGISITDTGCGISDERLEGIFRELEQVSTAGEENRPEVRAGVGLGLAVVARIVRNLEGQLKVESKVGEGSKFTFLLPFRLPSLANDRYRREAIALGEEADGEKEEERTVASGPASLLVRSNSGGSGGSHRSRASSDIDSLISAITSSHMDPVGSSTRRLGSQGQELSPSISNASAGRSSKRGHRQQKSGQVELEGTGVPLRPIRLTTPVEEHPPSTLVDSPRSAKRRALPSPSLLNASSDFTSSSSTAAVSVSSSPASETSPFELSPSNDSYITPSPRDELDAVIDKSRSPMASPRHISQYRAVKSKVDESERLPAMRVLVVEDELINRMILEKRLTKDGHSVVIAEHGGDALRLLEVDPHFDLVLMDLQMPILNGFEAATGIRSLEAASCVPLCDQRPSTILNGRLPILAVSASLHERAKHTIEEVGIDGWILKPVDFRRLASLMRGAIDREKRRDDVYRPGGWEKGGWLEEGPPRDGSRATEWGRSTS